MIVRNIALVIAMHLRTQSRDFQAAFATHRSQGIERLAVPPLELLIDVKMPSKSLRRRWLHERARASPMELNLHHGRLRAVGTPQPWGSQLRR